MAVLYIIVGSIFSLVAVIIAVVLSWSVPMLFVAYTGGGAVGIFITAAIVLAVRRARAEIKVPLPRTEMVSQQAETVDIANVGTPEVVAQDSASVVYLPEYRVAAARALFTRNQADRQHAMGGFGWPEEPPEELRLALLDLLSYERVRPEDIWDEIQDWLERNEAQCPSDVKAAQNRR